jgi:hypothetical protein
VTDQTDQTHVRDGHLIPNAKLVRDILSKLRDDIKRDPDLAVSFKTNPSQVLGDRGLSKPVQAKLMQEEGSLPADAHFAPMLCIHTHSCVILSGGC